MSLITLKTFPLVKQHLILLRDILTFFMMLIKCMSIGQDSMARLIIEGANERNLYIWYFFDLKLRTASKWASFRLSFCECDTFEAIGFVAWSFAANWVFCEFVADGAFVITEVLTILDEFIWIELTYHTKQLTSSNDTSFNNYSF